MINIAQTPREKDESEEENINLIIATKIPHVCTRKLSYLEELDNPHSFLS